MSARIEQAEDSVIMTIFGQTEKQIKTAIESDKSGWLESDYEEAKMMLTTLETGNPNQYKRFLSEWGTVTGKGNMRLQQRCQVIQFLLSSFLDWRKTGVTTLKTQSEAMTLIFEEAKSGTSPVTLSFQQVVDQILQFDPPSESLESWAEVFAHALRRPAPPVGGLRPIVQGSSTRRKSGRKPKSRS